VSRPTRVLVVDDSAFARKVLREVLSRSPDIEVVGTARDGLEALEKIAHLQPDVITLDLVMPNLDGLGVLRALPVDNAPRVVVVSISPQDSELAVAALQAGALDIARKPTALATEQLYELGDELVQKVKAAACARVPRQADTSWPEPALYRPRAVLREIIVIGTSTGGPQAITRLLAALPADLPVPVVVALHIPAGYTQALAERLDDLCKIDVREAAEGLQLRPGLAVIARGGMHVRLRRQAGSTYVGLEPATSASLYAPSVNVLFRSAAELYGAGTFGVVLTGMGDDGVLGSAVIHERGGIVLTESEISCVVYGMPRSVKEAGYSAAEAPLERMATEILSRL
jgi:two-component system, chemotaxis family, protein-glutamate methylesterase/glutaminase